MRAATAARAVGMARRGRGPAVWAILSEGEGGRLLVGRRLHASVAVDTEFCVEEKGAHCLDQLRLRGSGGEQWRALRESEGGRRRCQSINQSTNHENAPAPRERCA